VSQRDGPSAGAALPPGLVPRAIKAALGGDGPDPGLTTRELTHNAGNQATGGIWRVEGPAGRAVLKVATAAGGGDRAWPTSDDPRHWNSWRREVLAYRTGFAHTVYAGAGLGAPRLLAVTEPRPGVVALWLEDVTGLPGMEWPVDRLTDLARRLGTAQAAWVGRPPPHPWLSRRWLRQYVASKPIAEPVRWDDPRAAAAWPEAVRAGLRALWERRGELLDLAESLPRPPATWMSGR
jgi:hypothetical protein